MEKFQKSSLLIGGLLLVIGHGAGPYSIDGPDK